MRHEASSETPGRGAGAVSWTLVLCDSTVFVASLCIMVAELVAGRVIAQHLGASLYTWTSCIGVFLGGISIGNYIGGVVADRMEARRALALLFVVASLASLLVPVLNSLLAAWPWTWGLSWPMRIFVHVTATFILPAATLGTIGPVVAKMALAGGLPTGRTLGQVYAWGAVGSIVGTYLAGFLLIARLGSMATILAVSAVLAAMGLLYGWRTWLPRLWASACVAAWLLASAHGGTLVAAANVLRFQDPADPDVLLERESQYSHIWVSKLNGDANLRTLTLDRLTHSVVDLQHPTYMRYDYCQVYEGVLDEYAPTGRPLSTLSLGGGGYVFPRYLELTRPGSRIDVAEIDPAVTRAARDACGLPTNSAIRIHTQDARALVADLLRDRRAGRPAPIYDFILGDTFAGTAVPFQLTTAEFAQQLHELLARDGLYLLNCIDIKTSGHFLASLVRTCRAVFPCVYVVACDAQVDRRSTFVLVCSNVRRDLSDLPERIRRKYSFQGAAWTDEALDDFLRRAGGAVLTDDRAPVENLLAVDPVTPSDVARQYVEAGSLAARLGRIGKAESCFRRALRINPGETRALYNLAAVAAQSGRSAEALDLLARVRQQEPDFFMARDLTSQLLFQTGRYDELIQMWTDLLQKGRDVYAAHVNLGETYATRGDMARAIDHWEQALREQPGDGALHYKVGMASAALGRRDQAVREFASAMSARPDYAEPCNILGVLLAKQGDVEASKAMFAAGARPTPDMPLIREALRRIGVAESAVPASGP